MTNVDWSVLRSWHFTKEPSESEALEHEIRAAEREIRNWDKEDVNKLRDSIRDLKSKCEKYNKLDAVNQLHPEWLIRLNQVRGVHVPVFDFPRGYPVWACDRKGSCLCGDEYDKVEKITTIQNKKENLYEPAIETKYKELEASIKLPSFEVVQDTWFEIESHSEPVGTYIPKLGRSEPFENGDTVYNEIEGWGARIAGSDWDVFDTEEEAWDYLREAYTKETPVEPTVKDLLSSIKDKISAIEKKITSGTTKVYNDYTEFISAGPGEEGDLTAFVGQDNFLKVTETDIASGEVIQSYFVSPKLFNKEEMISNASESGATLDIQDIQGFGAEVDSLSKVIKPLQVFDTQEAAESYINSVTIE